MDKIAKEEKLTQIFPYLNDITIAGKTEEQHDHNVQKFLKPSKKRNLTFNEKKSVLSAKCINILGYQVSKAAVSVPLVLVLSCLFNKFSTYYYIW